MLNIEATSDFSSAEELKKAILRLVAFFDLFEYPLTPLEIRHYLDNKVAISRLSLALDELSASAGAIRLDSSDGFYFLPGREETITTRRKRHNYSQRKIKIAKKIGYFFNLLPSVKMIAVANSLGGYNLRDGSDIDFFIITSARRVWLSRLFCAGLAKILNRRPTAKHKRDRICLSFYAASDYLDFSNLNLPGFDPYFYYWQRSLIVLYNKEEKYQEFLAANGLPGGKLGTETKKSFFFGDYLEKVVKNWQLRIMPAPLSSQNGQDSGVMLNDGIIKLYLLDRRREFLKKYEEKIRPLS